MRFGDRPFPGWALIYGMPYEDYRAVDAVAWSTLREIGVSPERLKWVVENGRDTDESATWGPMGTAFHAALLEPAKFASKFATNPATYPVLEAASGYTAKPTSSDGMEWVVAAGRGKSREEHLAKLIKYHDGYGVATDTSETICTLTEKTWNANANFCKAWMEQAESSGMTILKRDDLQTARAMADRLLARLDVQAMMQNAQFEVSLFWVDQQTNIQCKARLDILYAADQIADPKFTSKPASWERWAGTVKALGYCGQASMYRDGLDAFRRNEKLPLHDVRTWTWLVAHADPPHSTYLYELQDAPGAVSWDWLQYGRALWHGYLQQLRYCIDHDEWPGGNSETEELAVPEWMKLDITATKNLYEAGQGRAEQQARQAEAESAFAAELDAMAGMQIEPGTLFGDNR